MYTHQIISMKAAKTKNTAAKYQGEKDHNDMWRCITLDGETVNVFKHDKPEKDTFHLFQNTGYGSYMTDAVEGQEITWRNYPIPVELRKDGDWWTVVAVCPISMRNNSDPDPVYVPNKALFHDKVKIWANAIVHSGLPVVFWDTETTGTGDDDEIISIAIMDANNNVLLRSLIKPLNIARLETRIGQEASAVNGITPADLLDAPTFAELYHEIWGALCGKIWVIYNAQFDTRMLDQDCLRHDLPLIPNCGVNCAMEMFSQYLGEWNPVYKRFESKKLSFACELFNIAVIDAHDALADVKMTADLCHHMRKDIPASSE